MDFSYKVIRNRFGSLVANAIQKRIDSNKGSQPFIVVVEGDGNGNYTTTVNSSQVIQAINENKLVIYKLQASNGNQIAISTLVAVIEDNINFLIYIAGMTLPFIHTGTTVSTNNG